MKKLFSFSVFFSLLFLFYSHALAEVPQMINYQGKLTKDTGAPLDTTTQMIFCIYADPITLIPLWCDTQMVVVEKGVFNVLLGSLHLIPGSVFDGNVRYLGVKVANDPEIPRKPMVSVGYAYNADMVDGINGSALIQKPAGEAQGDILIRDASGWTRLSAGTSGQYLKTQGSGSNPVWGDVTAIPADYSVSQAKLKTSTGEVSLTGNAGPTLFTLPGGEYGFYPQIKTSSAGNTATVTICGYGGNQLDPGQSYSTKISLRAIAEGITTYAQQRYITSSGKDHWIFFLGEKATKRNVASYQAPDHPCYGSGGNENDIPHPFGSYDPAKHEVILVDNDILPELKSKVTSKRSLLTVINEDYEVDFNSHPVYKPREIIEIDEYGDKEGEIIKKIETPEWAKILIGKDEIYLKRRLVETLPSYISYKKLKPKWNAITESPILSKR